MCDNTRITVYFGNDGLKVEAILYKDGDMWCVLSGEDLQIGIAGFGGTPVEAVHEFRKVFRNNN